ncbi:MAG: DUF2784 domain-containing protein [Mangrovibacterium sp.]
MQNFWLYILDVLFTLLHVVLIGFNLLGWIWKSARRLHFYAVLLTAFSWLILGIWFGWGYCLITDWQWQVKRKLGEEDLPGSFIKYMADQITGLDISTSFIDLSTAVGFGLATLLSVYLNFIRKGKTE